MSWITELAQDRICQVRIPMVCTGRTDTTVAAHYRSVTMGAGIGIKPHDLIAAHACAACHDCVDFRAPNKQFNRTEIRFMHAEGVLRTIAALISCGEIEISKRRK